MCIVCIHYTYYIILQFYESMSKIRVPGFQQHVHLSRLSSQHHVRVPGYSIYSDIPYCFLSICFWLVIWMLMLALFFECWCSSMTTQNNATTFFFKRRSPSDRSQDTSWTASVEHSCLKHGPVSGAQPWCFKLVKINILQSQHCQNKDTILWILPFFMFLSPKTSWNSQGESAPKNCAKISTGMVAMWTWKPFVTSRIKKQESLYHCTGFDGNPIGFQLPLSFMPTNRCQCCPRRRTCQNHLVE